MVTAIATSFTSPVGRMSYGDVLSASTALPTGPRCDSATHTRSANDIILVWYSLTENRWNMLFHPKPFLSAYGLRGLVEDYVAQLASAYPANNHSQSLHSITTWSSELIGMENIETLFMNIADYKSWVLSSRCLASSTGKSSHRNVSMTCASVRNNQSNMQTGFKCSDYELFWLGYQSFCNEDSLQWARRLSSLWQDQ